MLDQVFYHGTSSNCGIQHILMPPLETKIISEKGRKKNLDKVFFSSDIGLAKVYAGRACSQFGGEPKVYRVIPMSKVECINDSKGASVFLSDWAFVEEIEVC